MKKELQTLRDEIKTLAGQIQRKLKSEWSRANVHLLVAVVLFSLVGCLSSGIEPKKGEEDGKYIPINVRMQRTQVDSLVSNGLRRKPFSSANSSSKFQIVAAFSATTHQYFFLTKCFDGLLS